MPDPRVHIALPSHGRPALTRCAATALARTMTQPYRLWVVENDDPLLRGEWLDTRQGSYANGRKLDRVLAALPPDARWLVTMHTDSAPLLPGWLPWLIERVGTGVLGGFARITGAACPHPHGALYRVEWLRDTRASFLPRAGFDVGTDLPSAAPWIAPRAVRAPWWLQTGRASMREDGRLIWAHLGGGTIGPTKKRLRRWALRQLWPSLVARHLDRAGAADGDTESRRIWGFP